MYSALLRKSQNEFTQNMLKSWKEKTSFYPAALLPCSLSLAFAPNRVSKEFSSLVCLYLLTSFSLLSPPLALHWSFPLSRSPMRSSWLHPIFVDKDTPHSSVFILSYFPAACRLWTMPFLRHSSPPWSGFLLTFLPITLTPLHKPFFLCSSLRWWAFRDAVFGTSQSAVSLNEFALYHDFQIATSSPDILPEFQTQQSRCCQMPPLRVPWASQVNSLNWVHPFSLSPRLHPKIVAPPRISKPVMVWVQIFIH